MGTLEILGKMCAVLPYYLSWEPWTIINDGGRILQMIYLQLNASVTAIPSGLVQEILQRLQHLKDHFVRKEFAESTIYRCEETMATKYLLEEISLDKPGLEHFGRYWVSSLQQIAILQNMESWSLVRTL